MTCACGCRDTIIEEKEPVPEYNPPIQPNALSAFWRGICFGLMIGIIATWAALT